MSTGWRLGGFAGTPSCSWRIVVAAHADAIEIGRSEALADKQTEG